MSHDLKWKKKMKKCVDVSKSALRLPEGIGEERCWLKWMEDSSKQLNTPLSGSKPKERNETE